MGSVHPYYAKGPLTSKGEPRREDRRYRVIWRGPDHKQKQKRGFATKAAAVKFLTETEASIHTGTYVPPSAGKRTISDLGSTWIATKRNTVKPSTYSPLETAWRLRVEPKWGTRAVSSIRFSEVKQWVADLTAETGPRGATVVIRTYGVLASILDDAVHDGLIVKNPARIAEVGLPKKKPSKRVYLTAEQVAAVAKDAGQHGAIVFTLAYTGLRWAELVALRVENVDLTKNRLHVIDNAVEVGNVIHEGSTKSIEDRLVPLPQSLSKMLHPLIAGKAPRDLVFPGEDGAFMRRVRSSTDSRSWLKTALKRNGITGFTTHDFRHTTASLAVSAGANVKVLQRMLGHKDAAMTLNTYADLFDTDLETVSTALDSTLSRSLVANPLPEVM